MKKQIIALALISGLAFTSVASAGNWGKGNRGYGQNNACPQMAPVAQQQIDPATMEKIDKFMDDTLAIRKDLTMKRAEVNAMMLGDNPDPKAVALLTGQIFDLRTSIKDKAEAAGVSQFVGPKGNGMFGGNGKGGSRGARGMGMGRGFCAQVPPTVN